MSTKARRRILHDYRELVNEPVDGVYAFPHDDDIMSWDAIITGPEDTIWEGGVMLLKIKFEEDYPIHPPAITFVTPIYHPNIYTNGKICLSVLQSDWSQAFSIKTIMISIRSLLTDPNPGDPANPRAAQVYMQDRHLYEMHVRSSMRESWGEVGDRSGREDKEEKEEREGREDHVRGRRRRREHGERGERAAYDAVDGSAA